ncbi:hypothetical protein EGW08_016995, partial [Elysia chlorotica]
MECPTHKYLAMHPNVVLMALLFYPAIATGPSLIIEVHKEPNILFQSFNIVGKCSSCDPKYDDLVWAVVREGKTEAMADNLLVSKPENPPVKLCGAGEENASMSLSMGADKTLDGLSIACLARQDLGRPCDDTDVFCSSSIQLSVRIWPASNGTISITRLSPTPLDELKINNVIVISCVACTELIGRISWALQRQKEDKMNRINKAAKYFIQITESLIRNDMRACNGQWSNSTIYLKMTNEISSYRLVCFPFDYFSQAYQLLELRAFNNTTDWLDTAGDGGVLDK